VGREVQAEGRVCYTRREKKEVGGTSGYEETNKQG
jgi:hypothetical protein